MPFPLQEDIRQNLVISDNKVRLLETQVCEEQLASAYGRKVIIFFFGLIRYYIGADANHHSAFLSVETESGRN